MIFNRINNFTKLYNLRTFTTTRPLLLKQYTDTHEWFKTNSKTNITKVGLTNTVIQDFGELIYAEPSCDENDLVNKNDELILIESVKAADGINAPFDCKVIDINYKLLDTLDIANSNPECEDSSWFIKIEKQE